MIELCFLIGAISAQIFNAKTDLAIPMELPTYEAKADIETQPLVGQTKIRIYSK